MGKLTATQVKTLGPGRHPDGDNLYLEVISATSKSWTGRYTINGKEKWRGLGSTRTMTLKEARERHLEYQRLSSRGIDPKLEREQARAAAAAAAAKAVTFAELGGRFITAHEVEWKNPVHRQQWRNTLKTYAYPVIGDLLVTAIDTALAMKVLEPDWRRAPETMGRVRGRLEQIWDYGKAQGLVTGENPFLWRTLKYLLPAKGKIHKVEHHAAVEWRELPVLMAALRARASLSARALEFTILNASRVSEVTQARGCEFDLGAARWKIPGDRMKGGRPHTVMLSKRAVEMLRELHPDGLPDGRVFDLSGAAMSKMLRLAGYSDFTVHGTARASFRTWVDEATSFREAVAESCLAHVEADKVKAAYNRAEFEQQRAELMEMWSRHCASPPTDAKDKIAPLRLPA